MCECVSSLSLFLVCFHFACIRTRITNQTGSAIDASGRARSIRHEHLFSRFPFLHLSHSFEPIEWYVWSSDIELKISTLSSSPPSSFRSAPANLHWQRCWREKSPLWRCRQLQKISTMERTRAAIKENKTNNNKLLRMFSGDDEIYEVNVCVRVFSVKRKKKKKKQIVSGNRAAQLHQMRKREK